MSTRTELGHRAAIGQGARTAIVSFGGFSIGFWGLHRLQIAVFATFGGLALTGIANFGGTLRGRAGANAAAGVAGVVLASAGTWASYQSVGVAGAATFAVGALAVLLGLFGGYFAVASTATILYYLVAIGSPAGAAVIPDRIYGVLIGAVLAVVAAVALWPTEVGAPVLPLLAARMAEMGRVLRAPDLRLSIDHPGQDVRAAVELSGYRPAGPTRGQRAALSLLNDLERLDHLLRRAARSELSADDLAAFHEAGQRLSHAATTLTSGTALPGEGLDGGTADRVPVAPFGLAYRVRLVAAAAVAHAAATGRHVPGPADEAPSERLVDTLRHTTRRARANLSLRSVHLQDGLRTGLALALAYLLAHEFALEHGFWVELATVTVVRSGAAATSRLVGQAVAGTTAGVAIAFVLIEGIGADTAAYALVTPVAIAVAIYLRARNFPAGQAGFTVSVLLLFSLLKPSGWHMGIVRLEDVVVGVLAGLVASLLAWPRGASAAIGPAVADLIDTAAAYLVVVVGRRTAAEAIDGGPARVAVARRTARAAMLRAESAYSQLIAERADQTDTVAWSPIVAASNRLWYVADIIDTSDAASPDVISVTQASDRLERATRRASQSVRHCAPPPFADQADSLDGVSADHPLAAWIDDLAQQFRAFDR